MNAPATQSIESSKLSTEGLELGNGSGGRIPVDARKTTVIAYGFFIRGGKGNVRKVEETGAQASSVA